MNKQVGKSLNRGIKTVIILIGVLVIICALILAALLLFGDYRRDYCSGECPEWMRDRCFAHRGIHAGPNTDENSATAFQNAIDLGYAIELDLRFTKDMVPMVIHDNDLSRMTGCDRKLSSMTYAEAKELVFSKSGEKILSLEEALALVDGRVPLLIEIKAYHIPGEFEKNIVEILRRYEGQFSIQSYNPFALRYVKKLNPDITIGLLLNDVPGLSGVKRVRILKDNIFGLICHPSFISYNHVLLEEHELDSIRSDKHFVYGFVYHETDLESDDYKATVDGIIFERGFD